MILHYVECADATRHVHLADCGDLTFQKEAGDVWEVDVPDDAGDDDIIVAVWDDFFEGEEPDEDGLESYGELTVFMPCMDPEEESSGNAKADAFMNTAEDAGWATEFITDGEYVVVKARREYIRADGLRNEQLLELSWSPTRLIEAHHLSGLSHDVAKKLSSVKGAITLLTAPHPKPQVRAKVDRDEPVKRVLKESIPFDLENAYDDEIIAAVQGRTLVWWNNEADNYESHFCIKQKNHIKIETGTAGRAILTFVSPEGFRSVALEELVQVK